jgi:Carboxypeptidase regulatory-like domain/TonB-dependent Receptor Plug Domain
MGRFILIVIVFLCAAQTAIAQTQTTAEISGIITDTSGAVVPNAGVTAVSRETGLQRIAKANRDGYYSVALLPPGTYMLTVKADGFQTSTREGVVLSIDQTARVDFKLRVGSVSTQVNVQSDAPVIETSNPNTTTTVTREQLENLPNPGQDLTYAATIAPGAVMNVNSSNGYNAGNVEFNGLPSVANDFTIDGMDANDAWQSLNRSGASGLMLGLNSIQEASINTESYSADLGRLGASQINYVTKSGTNSFHGNAYEIWNGSSMNTTNYFIKANPNPPAKPFSNTNEFGGSIGGPILKSKLFFFTDLEGIRIVLPQLLNSTLPSPAYQQYVLQQLPLGGYDSVIGMTLPPQPGEVSLYKTLFGLLPDTSKGTPIGIVGCPFDVGGGTPVSAGAGTGCGNQLLSTASPPVSETLWTIKVDYVLSPKDSFWVRFQLNNGANTRVDAVNSAFDTYDKEPERAASAGWTHIFGPDLVNQFNPGFSYQNRVHTLANTSDQTIIPLAYSPSGFSSIGGTLGNIPYGDKTTTWQLNDNLSWTVGKHGFKFGENLRRNLYSSYESKGYAVTPYVYGCSLAEFTYGATCQTFQGFPTYGVDHLANVGLDSYAMDTYKLKPNFTVTAGLRIGWNSNPVSQEDVISRLVTPFRDLSHDVNQPLNQVIAANQHHLFADTYPLTWEPRVALAWEVRPKTVIRAGAGIFSNPLMGFLPSYLDENAPSDVFLSAGIFEPIGGLAIAPGVPGSAIDAAVQANQAFHAGFSSGVASCAATSPPANCVPVIGFTSFESKKQKFPTIYQWSFGVEQQFGQNFGLTVKYVGTHASNMFYSDGPNGYQTVCQGCFVNYPYNQAPDPRFGNIFPFETGANSSYNALQVSLLKRLGHGLSFQANYTHSHCSDYVSNGGVEIFNANENFTSYNGRLARLYGNCDFDVPNSFNASYLYQLPFHSSRGWLNQAIGGWMVTGTVYLRGGFPFSALSSGPAGGFINASPTLFANVVSGQAYYEKAPISGVTQPGTIQWLNPDAFQSVVDPTSNTCYPSNSPANCQDGNSARNLLRAPGFKWTDFDIVKRFPIKDRFQLRFDVQIYNLFNHPNFGFPNTYYGSPGNVTAGIPGKTGTLAGFGNINTTLSPSTGLLGGGLGGDSSVRMVALRAGFEF